jgi:hypothetical protein
VSTCCPATERRALTIKRVQYSQHNWLAGHGFTRQAECLWGGRPQQTNWLPTQGLFSHALLIRASMISGCSLGHIPYLRELIPRQGQSLEFTEHRAPFTPVRPVGRHGVVCSFCLFCIRGLNHDFAHSVNQYAQCFTFTC